MIQKNTLSELTQSVRAKHPHVAELAELRERARARVNSMLATLRSARDHARLTQTAIAKKLGVSQATISRWESGEEEISLRDFVFFTQACNEKVALIAVPADTRFSDEDLVREVVSKLIEQLYPELDLEEVFSTAKESTKPRRLTKKARLTTSEAAIQRSRRHLGAKAARQAKAAAQTATSGFWGLGVALETLEEVTE